MLSVTRVFEWDSAHRLVGHEGACAALHGHRYRAEITVSKHVTDELGRILDFTDLKSCVNGWINRHWDHTTIVWKEDKELIEFCTQQVLRTGIGEPYVLDDNPTAEAMAEHLHKVTTDLLENRDKNLRVDKVVIFETPNCFATYLPK